MSKAKRLSDALATIHWGPIDIAKLLSVNERTARRWIAGQNDPPDRILDWLDRLATFHRDNPAPVHMEADRPLPTTIAEAGYIVTDTQNYGIYSVGSTKDDAWDRFLDEMARNNTTVLNEHRDDMDNCILASDYTIRPATAALLSEVDENGGDIGWNEVNGICCTCDEAE